MLSNSSIGFADEVLEKVSFNKLCIVSNKVLLYKNDMIIFLQWSSFAFHPNCSKLFLSVESYCFDERNLFRQFSESLQWVEALFAFFKKWSSLC